MYLSQTNGPAYCRLVGSVGRNARAFPTNAWVPWYGGDYGFEGDFPFGRNPVFISEPMRVCDVLGISEQTSQLTAEPDLFKFEKPFKEPWSSDADWLRYGSRLGAINKIVNLSVNQETPRENEVIHRHYDGTVFDVDVPFFDYHTVSYQGYWYSYVPLFDVLDSVPYRDLRATDINSDGFYTFEFRSTTDIPGTNAPPTTEYWTHVHKVCDQIAVKGYLAGLYGYGDWPYRDSQPNGTFLFVTSNLLNSSVKKSNWWHIDIEYDWEIRYALGADWWYTKFRVHQDLYAWFQPVYGTNNPFDWHTIHPDVFQVSDHSSCQVLESNIFFDGHSYSRFPVDEVSPPVVIDCAIPTFQKTYNTRLFAQPLQSSVGERSRFWMFNIHQNVTRDPHTYHLRVTKRLDDIIDDVRTASFFSSSDALHKAIDVISANNIENLAQLGGILELLPDFPKIGRTLAMAANRDPRAILEIVDILTDAILKVRFGIAPNVKDAGEILRTDIASDLREVLQKTDYTTYGDFKYSFSFADMKHVGLPGSLSLVARSKVRIHTNLTSLLASYLTANSMGMMPTLSRLWANVPFSFVVDWFTGMSDRLQSIDDQLLWMALNTSWCTHSFKLSYIPDPSEYLPYGLGTSSDDPLRLTYYRREFSRLMPHLTDCRFDFQQPDRGPDPVTVGALVWQKL